MIKKIGEGFHGEDLECQLKKVHPNESGILNRFAFVRWHVDLVEGPEGYELEEEVTMDSIEEE